MPQRVPANRSYRKAGTGPSCSWASLAWVSALRWRSSACRRADETGDLKHGTAEGPGPHWLLIRRRISDGFAAGKELAALDEHQVRSWTSWHRRAILALLACAFLSVLAATQPGSDRTHDQLIPLTRHEIRRLFAGLSHQPPDPRCNCTAAGVLTDRWLQPRRVLRRRQWCQIEHVPGHDRAGVVIVPPAHALDLK